MHTSSYAKMASFIRTYESSFPRRDGTSKLLEIGSRVFHGQLSYRELITHEWIEYIGLDLEPGENVDLVPANGMIWREIEDETIDVCISGQTFEHNPYFWITMAEISRVLVPNGIACIIAPGGSAVHRYPLDCWRFYPDSWAALCALTGLEPIEVYFETDSMALSVVGGHARDSMVIARKPGRPDPAVRQRLSQLVKPVEHTPITFDPVPHREGPCIRDYRKTAPTSRKWRARLAQFLSDEGPVRLFESDPSG